MLGRREAWPAVVILGLGILTLAVTLKAAQEVMPVEPVWLMGVIAGLYLVLAFGAGQFTWRAPALLLSMLLAHSVMALLMGWGYAAVEGHARSGYEALVQGLWMYLPGTALQFGFSCVVGIVLDAHLNPDRSAPEETEEETAAFAAETAVDLSEAPDAAAALAGIVAMPGVAGALLSGSAVYAAGVWERDPVAALGRVRALLASTGSGLNSFPLGAVNLLTRSQSGFVAALLADQTLDRQAAHALLRELWVAGERLAAEEAAALPAAEA